MGFRLGRTYRLMFEGQMEGAEILLRSTTIGVTEQLRSVDAMNADERNSLLAKLLVEHVTEWNLETASGDPLPVSVESVREHMEEAVLAKICREWYKAAVGITAPLDPPSSDGDRLGEVSLPMEALSPSQTN